MIWLAKATRLFQGGQPRVLDLFSGCGGISLGFQAAGFDISASVEMDPHAAASHGFNFHRDEPAFSESRDITLTTPHDLASALGLGTVENSIDVIVGGPPCQAYARIGRSKLREISQHPDAYLHDHRANLFESYVTYVAAFQPLALMMENVPDIMNQGGQNVAQIMADDLEELGYVVRYTLLNAAYYGVPQMRERMFLIAYRQELNLVPEFPEPTHRADLPAGYLSARQVALKVLRLENLFGQGSGIHYLTPPVAPPDKELKEAVSAEAALGDLPGVSGQDRLKRGTRRFNQTEGLTYRGATDPTEYAMSMRTWPGFEAPNVLRDHVVRYLPRDYRIFAEMNPGDQYPQALEHALRLFQQALKLRPAPEGSAEWLALKKQYVPPYDASKFPNKWRKMEADKPARTLMAHLGKDSYSHIHYDDAEARTISVREAARLQSFPDGFVFRGTMNPAFRQIGNAVPPLLAKALATTMRTALDEATARLLEHHLDLQPA